MRGWEGGGLVTGVRGTPPGPPPVSVKIPPNGNTPATGRATTKTGNARTVDWELGVPPDPEDDPGEAAHQEMPDDERVLRRGQLESQPLGERFGREHLRNRFIYAREIGWHQWDGTRWKRGHEDDVISEAHKFVIKLVKQMLDDEADDGLIKSMLRYRDISNLVKLVRAARTVPALVVSADQLDACPGLLNCTNGTVDLRSGRLLTHDPRRLITKTTGVDYRPAARHQDWARALTAIPDDQTSRWLQTYLGSGVTGETDRDAPVTFHKGLGENGKSTVIGAVVAAAGEFAVMVPDKLLSGAENGHETVWMPLRGARLAYLEELPEEHVLPVARIKKLASTPQITAREIGKNNVTWDATHILIVATNYFPKVSETDHGTWRRLAMIDYPVRFTGAAKDPRLKSRLRSGKAQREAVLTWLVEGARRWYESGGDHGTLPEAVRTTTTEWRHEGDEIGKFLAERVEVTGQAGHRITTADLLEQVKARSEANRHRPWSDTKLGQRLRAHHFVTENDSVTYDRGPRNRLPTGLTGVRWVSWT